MSRFKRYIETDVLTEARKRIHHIFDIFDSVVVMFSGGKDSLAVLHLTHEVMQERGMTKPVDVSFIDEELIPDEVVDFVEGYRHRDWVKMIWWTVPLESEKYILGRCQTYIQWDPSRSWVRPKPVWGEGLPAGDTRTALDQYAMGKLTAARFKGKVALLNGIRATESLVRYRSCMTKLHENYINAVPDPKASNIKFCKPIFDWEENDVFRYFYDQKIPYCKIYDQQMWARQDLRVSTPLHAQRAKKFGLTKVTTPEFYERLMAAFPEMYVQERYYDQIDRGAVVQDYGTSYAGVRQWIDDNIGHDPKNYALAIKRFDDATRAAKAHLVPPKALLKRFMEGAFQRNMHGVMYITQDKAQ